MHHHHLLTQRNGTYYFRQRIPYDLVFYLGRQEIVKSLKTKDISVALRKLHQLAIELEDYFTDIRHIGYAEAPKSLWKQSKMPLKAKKVLPSLSDALKSWSKGSGAKPSTIAEATRYIHCLIDLIGDLPIDQYSAEHARSLRDALARQPKNQLRHYPELNYKQFIAKVDAGHITGDRLAAKSINKYLELVSAVFAYAIDVDGYLKDNPFSNIRVRSDKHKKPQRKRYTNQELESFFNGEWYSNETYRDSMEFWVPLLALYSGARRSEICQLYTTDIKQDQETGVWFIDCYDLSDEGKQSLKNSESRKRVPIHSELIKIGFLDYWEKIQKDGHTQLFPKAKRLQGKWGKEITERMPDYLRSVGIPKEPHDGYGMHLFRHTFISVSRGYISRDLRTAIEGHAHTAIDETYGEFDTGILARELLKLQYNIDLSHIHTAAGLERWKQTEKEYKEQGILHNNTAPAVPSSTSIAKPNPEDYEMELSTAYQVIGQKIFGDDWDAESENIARSYDDLTDERPLLDYHTFKEMESKAASPEEDSELETLIHWHGVASPKQSDQFHRVMQCLLKAMYDDALPYFALHEATGDTITQLPDYCFMRKPYQIYLNDSIIKIGENALEYHVKLKRKEFEGFLSGLAAKIAH